MSKCFFPFFWILIKIGEAWNNYWIKEYSKICNATYTSKWSAYPVQAYEIKNLTIYLLNVGRPQGNDKIIQRMYTYFAFYFNYYLGLFSLFCNQKRIKYNNIYNILNMYQAIDYMEIGYFNFPRFFFLFFFCKGGGGGYITKHRLWQFWHFKKIGEILEHIIVFMIEL